MSLIIVVAPLYFLLQGVVAQLGSLSNAINSIRSFEGLLNLNLQVDTIVAQAVPILEKSLSSILANTIHLITNLVIFYFLLYYLLIESDGFMDKVKRILPFNHVNKNRVIQRFKDVTKATILGSLLIAIIQGTMLWFGFHMLGIPGALFWGMVTAIISFVPVIGSPIIWVPASIILFVGGNIWQGFALLVWIIISSVDNVIRPITNKKFGQIHPLTSVIGVFIGISQFGILGIFIGPLILAYFILLWNIYKEEYLDNK